MGIDENIDLQHHLLSMMLDGTLTRDVTKSVPNVLHLAPVTMDNLRVLDVDTGTGLWSMDFGELYLHTQ